MTDNRIADNIAKSSKPILADYFNALWDIIKGWIESHAILIAFISSILGTLALMFSHWTWINSEVRNALEIATPILYLPFFLFFLLIAIDSLKGKTR